MGTDCRDTVLESGSGEERRSLAGVKRSTYDKISAILLTSHSLSHGFLLQLLFRVKSYADLSVIFMHDSIKTPKFWRLQWSTEYTSDRHPNVILDGGFNRSDSLLGPAINYIISN